MLDPITLAQLTNLELRARRILDGVYSGQHANILRGHSQDFSEHRPYNPGDDLRDLDWKIFGRTDRLVVKLYEEQTNVQAMVAVDDSASMNFSYGGRPSKLEYAKTMAAAVGYLIVRQRDAVGLSTSNILMPPNSQYPFLTRYFEELTKLSGHEAWDFPELVMKMASTLHKRSFIIVFTDLMNDEERTIKALESLGHRKHEVMVFQLLDPAEVELPFEGTVVFDDMETHQKIQTDPSAIRDRYRQLVQSKLATFSHRFRSSGLDYTTLTTDTPFDRGMGAYLSWRARHW